MTTLFLGLGSNIGDRAHYLEQARHGLLPIMQNMVVSNVIETAPLYVTDQPAFLNQVVMGDVHLSLMQLLDHTQLLQSTIGRTKTYLNGPREIDIDILYYGEVIIDTPTLTVPHPRIAERLFVLEPLCEIAPNWLCPVTQKTMHQLLNELSSQ